jgi:microsomal dipeptidase-like Zn-dependent dipeptidase
MQVDIHKLLKGHVGGFLAAHYLPERGMKEQANGIKKLFPKLKFIAPVFSEKLENGNNSNFRQLTTMMDDFEAHLERTNEKKDKTPLVIARSYSEFESIIASGKIAVAHSIEGSHSLGREMGNTPAQYLENLRRLSERGVCLITIAHFFQNDLSSPVEGIPPSTKKQIRLNWKYHPALDNKGLTETGKAVVGEMLEIGMIVDITHLAPAARDQVFEINEQRGERRRPIIFTHTGVLAMFDGNGKYCDYRYMGASNEEIEKVKKCNGVIGVVFMNYWLVGSDTHTHKGRKKNFKKGIKYVIQTVKYIRDKTGSYAHVALGSDFDGFADAPADLKNPSFYPKLVERLRKELGCTQSELDMITHGNALRVLKEGWH